MKRLLALLMITTASYAQDEVNFTYVLESTALVQKQEASVTGKDILTGFCGELYNYLNQLNNDYRLDSPIAIEYKDRYNRFKNIDKITNKSTYGVICAANTIRADKIEELSLKNGNFSNSFYSSQMAVLLKKDDVSKLQKYDPNNLLKVGIIGSANRNEATTTEDIFKIFPADRRVVSGRDTAQRILLDPNNNEIEAYTSDKVLLDHLLYMPAVKGDYNTTLVSQGYIVYSSDKQKKYERFSTEPYGIIVYNKKNPKIDNYGNPTNKLLNDINEWLTKDAGLKAISLIDKSIEDGKEIYLKNTLNIFEKLSESSINIDWPKYNFKIPTLLITAVILASLFLYGLFYTTRKVMKNTTNQKRTIILIHKSMDKHEKIKLKHAFQDEACFVEAGEVKDIRENKTVDEKTKNKLIDLFLEKFSEETAKELASLLFFAIKK